jgi:hypothetical protein
LSDGLILRTDNNSPMQFIVNNNAGASKFTHSVENRWNNQHFKL